jgi:hypothetical protein
MNALHILREARMATVIIVVASVGFLLLFGATVTLVFLNWSEKTLTPVLSILVVGTATTLAAVVVSLKSATVESAFTTSVVLDTVSGIPPFVNVDPNNSRLSDRLSGFVRLGQPAINQDGKTVVTIQKPNDEGERFTFCGELLQYHLLRTIESLQRGGWKAGMSYGASTATVTKPMKLSSTQDFPGKAFLKVVAANRFSNSDMERFGWEHGHFPLPKDATVTLIHLPPSLTQGTEKFIVRLKKPRFFVIDFTVEPLLATGLGIFPKGVSAAAPEVAARCQTYQFQVTMKATFEWITPGINRHKNTKIGPPGYFPTYRTESATSWCRRVGHFTVQLRDGCATDCA